MKKIMYATTLLIGLSMMVVSCSVSPEKQAIKDAKAMNKALEKNDVDAMTKAEKTMEKHLQKYDYKDKSTYWDTYKDNLK